MAEPKEKTTGEAFGELLEIVVEGYPHLPKHLQARVDRYAVEMKSALREVGVGLVPADEEEQQ